MTHDDEPRSLPSRLVLVAAVAVVGMGVWGFTEELPGSPLLERVYRSLQLFVLETGDLAGALPWQLEVARLAAPVLTVMSAVLATAAMSRSRIDRWRARRRTDHVVVCGLGRRGTAAALALRAAGHDVVAIERDAAGIGTSRCRRARIPVVIGDARDGEVLVRAGVTRAGHLVTLTPALESGGEIALTAVDLVAERTGSPLTVHLEVDQPELAGLMRAASLTEHRSPAWRLEELDLAGSGARVMLDALPPWDTPPASSDRSSDRSSDPSTDTPGPEPTPHVLVVGDSPLTRALVDTLVRRWRHRPPAPGPITVTVCPPGPPTPRGRADGTDGVAAPGDGVEVHHAVSLRAVRDAARDPWGVRPVTRAYVSVDDDATALATALEIVTDHPRAHVLVRLEQATALAELLRRDLSRLTSISLDELVLTPAVLLDTTVERIARALHDSYRSTAAGGDPAAAPWERLPESLRASNRAQAAHLAEKIRRTGRTLVPDDGDRPDRFTEPEVDELGELEHERWTAERLAAGWTPGPRDPHARTSPFLVPWEQLDDEVREIDRRFVRALPEILAETGLVLRRVGPRRPPGPG